MTLANAFFALAETDQIDTLLAQYRNEEKQIKEFASKMKENSFSVFHYFCEGNLDSDSIFRTVNPHSLFEEAGALSYLKSIFWTKVMNMTKVWDLMPMARREEWNKQISEKQTPDFTEDNVRSTIISLLNSRLKFVAEKIDGVFHNLSDTHVTNCPEGFGRRFIVANVLDKTGHPSSTKTGYIDDLRSVIAKITNKGDILPSSYKTLQNLYQNKTGEWIPLDGNTLLMKVFKKGTVHFEINEDISFQLNDILAHLYPMAIPEKNRKPKPVKQHKNFTLLQHSLPYPVLTLLNNMSSPPVGNFGQHNHNHYWTENKNSLRFDSYIVEKNSKDTLKAAENVIYAIGGIRRQTNAAIWYEFDYSPRETLLEIVMNGCIPDHKSHQFYPTQEPLAMEAIEMADISENDTCLEPSAGQGGLLKFMPKDTLAIEISNLNFLILKEKGYNAVHDDFITWAEKTSLRFSRIVMNPPFSEGRALQHTQKAFSLLKENGVLVAIIPATYRNQVIIEGKEHEYSAVKTGFFQGTNVSVVLVKIYN